MNKLTPEQADALHEHGEELRVVDPTTDKVYVIVDPTVLQRARALLEHQQAEDLAAIQAGIEDTEAGRTIPISEAHAQIRDDLRSKYGQ